MAELDVKIVELFHALDETSKEIFLKAFASAVAEEALPASSPPTAGTEAL